MKKILFCVALCACLWWSNNCYAQTVSPLGSGGGAAASIVAGTTTITGCSDKQVLFTDSTVLGCDAGLTYTKATDALTIGGNATLLGEASNALAQRNGTNAQTFNVYNTFTDASNYERLFVGWSSNQAFIRTQGTGTGSNSRDLLISSGGTLSLNNWNILGGRLSNSFYTLGDQAQVFAITATQPASPTGTQNAITATITGAGSASQSNSAFQLTYSAGYTGASKSSGLAVSNANLGTGSIAIPSAGSNSIGNFGVVASVAGNTTGLNAALVGEAFLGTTSVGVIGHAQSPKNGATNIGVVGSAVNTGTTPVMIGGFFSLNQVAVPNVSAALIADNGAQTSPIFLARDNGTTVFTIADGGDITSTGALSIGVTAPISWTGRGGFRATSDGRFVFWNNAANDFDRLQLGGTTSSFPALKRSTTSLQARLADDSAFTDFGARLTGVQGFTVAALPTPGSAGWFAYVTDQLTTCAAAGAALVGGGAVVCPVFYNGTIWVGG